MVDRDTKLEISASGSRSNIMPERTFEVSKMEEREAISYFIQVIPGLFLKERKTRWRA